MVKTSIAFLLGCSLFMQVNTLTNNSWLLLLPIALFCLIIKPIRLLAFIFLGLFWSLFQANLYLNDQLPVALENKNIAITGTIINLPQHTDNRLRFEFRPDHHSDFKLPNILRLNWYRPFPVELNAGEKWQLTVRLKRAYGLSNPGSFDYEAWLFQHGITATGYVRNTPNNHRLKTATRFSFNTLRQSLLKQQHATLSSSDYLGIINGLTTGYRDNISRKQWQILQASGTAHLLAISGLHIGLAALIGFFCFRWLWTIRKKNLLLIPTHEMAAIGSLLIAFLYTGLAGFSIPSQRALLMVATVSIAILFRRSIAPFSLLGLSLFIVLIIDPLVVLSAGFWLSFSAVAIILYTNIGRHPKPHWQWLKMHSLIALGLSPLLLLFFQQTSLIAPIANLITIPFISFIIVPLLLLSSLLLVITEPLGITETIGILLLKLVEYLLSLFWPFLDYLASLPLAKWTITTLPFHYYVIIAIACLLLLSPRGLPAKNLALLALTPLFLFSPKQPHLGEFWFTLLDVGQGLSAVVQTHSHTLVFDTGPRFNDSFNTGTAVVRPFLLSQGLKKINTLIISHADNDHIGGALPLIKSIPVHKIISSVPELLPAALPCTAGDSWQWDNVTFEFLHPQINDQGSENNLSCVLKVNNDQGSLLLTGDIEHETEDLLIQRYGTQLQSTILVAPHHGSKTSSSLEFIHAVQPKFVLYPAGYQNRFNFPHDIVVHRYNNNKIKSFNTSHVGAISFKFNHNGVSSPDLWRQNNQHIWTSKQ